VAAGFGRAYGEVGFFDPGATAVVRPPTCSVPAGDQPRYDPVTYGEDLLANLDANHSDRQSSSR